MFFTKESPIITVAHRLLCLVVGDDSCLATAFAFLAGPLLTMPLVQGNSALSLFSMRDKLLFTIEDEELTFELQATYFALVAVLVRLTSVLELTSLGSSEEYSSFSTKFDWADGLIVISFLYFWLCTYFYHSFLNLFFIVIFQLYALINNLRAFNIMKFVTRLSTIWVHLICSLGIAWLRFINFLWVRYCLYPYMFNHIVPLGTKA